MRKLLCLLLAALPAFGACGNGYSFCRQITIPAQSAQAADVTDFGFNHHRTESWLATIANGGKVNNTVAQTGGAAITVPADLVFTSDAGCSTLLPFEFTEYNPVTGYINVFINVGTNAIATPNLPWECYGKVSQTTFAGNVTGTWGPNVVGKWHLTNVAGAVDAHDSIGVNNGTVTGVTVAGTAGPVGAAAAFTGAAGSYINVGTSSTLDVPGDLTMSAWIRMTDFVNNNAVFTRTNAGSPAPFDSYMSATSGFHQFFTGSQTTVIGATTGVAVNTWALVSIVITGNTAKHYTNGVPHSGTPATNATHTAGGTRTAYIGTRADFSTKFKGSMQEVSFHNTARSASRLREEYLNQFDPVSYYSVGAELTLTGSATQKWNILN